ncbi:MAG: arsenite methyltransferase [Polyangiaceae bacterium]|jgi:SAM-dependent methyltransferase|nr:arsenite methyltransferase [Polyangiaceae bacterium]
MTDKMDIHKVVKDKYGKAVKLAVTGAGSCCCGSSNTALPGTDPITRDLYSASEAAELPADALLASFGCGNPTALAQLQRGEVVLDLGSGGGIDVLLSAKRVGPTGKAYGLDMTPEMLELARSNQKKAGVTNAEFLQGTIENIPLPDASVDVIVSNCVINLSPDKGQVLREAFRVLRRGGRLAVSDIVLTRQLPEAVRKSIEAWAGCVAGALLDQEYRDKLAAAGFVKIDIEPTRVYTKDDAQQLVSSSSCCGGEVAMTFDLAEMDGAVMSAFVRASKP